MHLAIERMLADSPYQPLRAASVRAGPDGFCSRYARPAILLDVVLLGRRELAADSADCGSRRRSADIPLIVTSSTGEARKAKHLGADEYLAKPVDGEGA